MKGGCTILNHQQWHHCQNAEKYCFYSGKGKHFSCEWRIIAVAGTACLAYSSSCATNSNNQILKCLTDTSILTMIDKRFSFICVLTRNQSNDIRFLTHNRPFQLSTFPATTFRVCERVHPKADAPEENLEIVTNICYFCCWCSLHKMHVRSCLRWFTTDKRSPMSGKA